MTNCAERQLLNLPNATLDPYLPFQAFINDGHSDGAQDCLAIAF